MTTNKLQSSGSESPQILPTRSAIKTGSPVAVEPKVRFRSPSWLCSNLGRESDPNQTTPRVDAFVFGDEVTRWFS